MRTFVSLKKEKDFKKFFKYIVDSEGLDLFDLMVELGFDATVLFYFNEQGEVFWNKIPEDYLGEYFVSTGSSFDRIGHISTRLCIKLGKIRNVDELLNEIDSLKSIYFPLAGKIDSDIENKTFTIKKEEFDEYKKVSDKLYYEYHVF